MSSSEDDPAVPSPKEPTAATQTQTETAIAAPEEISPGRQKLKSWLNKMLRIKMTDGRVLIGEFNCTDRDANVIMSMTSECSADDDSEERLIGLAMVPGKHIVSIEIDLGYDWQKQFEQGEEEDQKEAIAACSASVTVPAGSS